MANLEIKKQFDKFSFDDFSDIIIVKSVFFKLDNAGHKIDQKIKSYNIFFESIAKIVKQKKKVHIQVPGSINGDEIGFLFDELSEVSDIKRSRIPSHVMLYKENDVAKIAKKVIRGTLPALAINVAMSKISDVSKGFNFKIINKQKSRYNGPKPSDVAIIVDKDFSEIKYEELHLSDFSVIRLSKSKVSNSDVPKNNDKVSTSKTVPNKIDSRNNEKIKQAQVIHSDLKKKASEFLYNAMSYKRKSDYSKKMIDRINKQHSKSSSIDPDIKFALKQCAIDESNYNSMSQDFLELYEEINSQIEDVKSKINILKITN